MSIPLICIVPFKGNNTPQIILNRVVLPEPFSPVITVVLPLEKFMEN